MPDITSFPIPTQDFDVAAFADCQFSVPTAAALVGLVASAGNRALVLDTMRQWRFDSVTWWDEGNSPVGLIKNAVSLAQAASAVIVGSWDASSGAFPVARPDGSGIRVGDTWAVIVSGTTGGEFFEAGDYLQAVKAGGGPVFAGAWARSATGQIKTWRDEAQRWATENEDVPVETSPDQFSAKHHAIKSAASAEKSEQSAASAALYDPTFRFPDVPALLASTRAAGGEGTIWQAGQFLYKEAASGATDHHVTTEGGVKLYALVGENAEYNWSQFPTLAKAFVVAARAKTPLVLSGSHTVSSQLLGIISGDAELHLRLAGDVTITVDPDATWFRQLILLQTDTINNVSITGGNLTIIGNKKISNGLWLRHLEAADGGTINIAAPVTVLDLEGPASPDVAVGGIVVFGRYRRIVMQSPRVEDVTRLSTGGECSGISCSDFVGDVEIYSPVTKRIFTGPSLDDADGIKTFGFARNGLNNRRDGRVRIYDPVFEDCQGRSFKDQCGNTIVYRPRVIRDAAVVQAITNSHEFDFQTGDGWVVDPIVDYTSDGATSPLGASSSIVAFQHKLADSEMVGRVSNLTMISDVSIPRIALGVYNAAAQRSSAEIDGVKLMPKAGFTGSMVARAVFEVAMNTIGAKSTKTRIKVRGVDGPGAPAAIGYVNYDGSDLTNKFSWSVTDCRNSLGGTPPRPFAPIAGSLVLAVEEFEMHGLTRYRDIFTGNFALDFRKLTVGTVLSVDIATVNATNPPPWGASGYAHIRCEGQWFGENDRTVWVVKENATNVWFTRDGGASWGVIK